MEEAKELQLYFGTEFRIYMKEKREEERDFVWVYLILYRWFDDEEGINRKKLEEVDLKGNGWFKVRYEL